MLVTCSCDGQEPQVCLVDSLVPFIRHEFDFNLTSSFMSLGINIKNFSFDLSH